MLELNDLQHFVITRVPALFARYEFLSFDNPDGSQKWLSEIRQKVRSVNAVNSTLKDDRRWVTLAFTWNGLKVLGLDEESLLSFPEEFRQGMVARAEVLGDVGINAPENWVGDLASPDVHAIVILFARTREDCERSRKEHEDLISKCPGVRLLSFLDLEATPPFEYAHDHFGYRDRLTEPVIEGTGRESTPGSDPPLKAGEFVLGYVDESGEVPLQPKPAELSKNGTYMAYRRLEEHVGVFREFLQQEGKTKDEQEFVAAKLMGRWRSGAPLALAPEKDNPELANDPQKNNDFNYKQMDPHGYRTPLGCHIRRMNPRDTASNITRRRMIRRGATYGPALPEDQPDDGVERGIAAFAICASLIRQFEFAQNVWVNDKNFHGLKNERDPFIGAHDGKHDFKIPNRPIRRTITGLPSFTTVRGGAYFFLPSLTGLQYLSNLRDSQKFHAREA